MKTSMESISGVEKRIRVEIPVDEVDRRVEKGYAEVRRIAPLRGFRKGKAPMSMVRRIFKESVESDVAEGLVRESLAEAVKEKGLKVLSLPKVDSGKLTEGREFVFTATVEVVPEVVPKDYRGIPVVRTRRTITDADVDAAIERLRDSLTRYHAIEGRGAGPSDLVEFSFTATSGGETIEKSDFTSILLEAGAPLGKEFDAGLAGVRAGEERTFEVPFEPDFPNEKFAGKRVVFQVKASAVREKVVPERNDEFAKSFGDVTTLAELAVKVRDRLVREAEGETNRKVEQQLRKVLQERNPVEIPRTLVDRRTVSMIEDTASRLASQGVDLKKVNLDFDKMREGFAPEAEQAVRVSLLLSAIAEREGFDIPFSEIEAELKTMAQDAGVPYEKVRELYGDEERMDGLRNRLLERKAMVFLAENAEVREEAAE